jgi:hypothetical protein
MESKLTSQQNSTAQFLKHVYTGHSANKRQMKNARAYALNKEGPYMSEIIINSCYYYIVKHTSLLVSRSFVSTDNNRMENIKQTINISWQPYIYRTKHHTLKITNCLIQQMIIRRDSSKASLMYTAFFASIGHYDTNVTSCGTQRCN